MEQTVIFRDYQKAQTEDFNDIQSFAQQTFDDLVGDAVTASLRYAGFNTVQSNTAEITVAPGRFYGTNTTNEVGAIFSLPTQSILSLVQYLCISQATQKILTLVVYGSVDQTNIETRDFLTNIQTLQTQPQAVAMTSSRDAVLAVVAGAESAIPTPPVINVGQVAIASITVDANGIDSVTMLPAAQVASTEGLNGRLTVVEGFDAQISPRLASLASDIASLANQLAALSPATTLIIELMKDVALLKATAGLPQTYAQYGASYFMWADPTQHDITNAQSLGFNCTLYDGIRFPAQNSSQAPLALFNPIDPNATYNATTGLLLPTYTDSLSIQTGSYSTSIAIGQYGYQTFTNQIINIPYMSIQYGGSYYICSNTGGATYTAPAGSTLLPNFTSTEVLSSITPNFQNVYHSLQNYLWLNTWTEPYWDVFAVNHTINGALIAQSFLVSSDMWITRIGIYLATIASPSADININLCQCTNGQPDLTAVIGSGTLTSANLVVGMNYLEISPAFAVSGSRLAVTVISNANHQLGLAAAGSYLDGTFFYSLDGAYFLGDFTKEMVLQIWTAKFNTNQTTIEFTALSLQGGIRAIDLRAQTEIPGSCSLTYETQESGSGTWLPVAIAAGQTTPPFSDAPVLLLFRGRFIGSPNVMPGIILPSSVMTLWCPAATFTYVSLLETLAAPTTTSITIQISVQNFNLTAHSVSVGTGPGNGYIAVYTNSGLTRHNPTSVTVSLVDALTNTYTVTALFNLTSISAFTTVIVGTTNSVANVFLVGQLVWWAI